MKWFGLRVSQTTGRIQCVIDDNVALKTTDGTTDVTDGALHHLACVFDRSANVTAYVDGTSEGTPTDISGVGDIDNGDSLRIGLIPGDLYPVNGTLDELRISNNTRYTFNFAVPTAEFTTDGNTAGLWHMNEGTGQTAADSSGNGNDGQLGSTGGADANDPTWIGADETSHTGLSWGSPTSPINELTNFTITLSNVSTVVAGDPWWFAAGLPGDDAWWNIYDENDLRWLYAANQTYTASYPHIGLDSGLHTLYGYSNDTDGTEFTDTLALTVRDYDPIAYAALSLSIIGFVAIFGFIYRKRR